MATSRRDATEDVVPLVRATKIVEPKTHNRQRVIVALALASLAVILLVFNSDRESDSKDVESKPKHVTRPSETCTTLCNMRTQQRNNQSVGDLLDVNHLQRSAKAARDNQIARLKELYGDKYYSDIFEAAEGKSRAKQAFISADQTSDISTQRFKRKLMMKLLTVQTAVLSEEMDFNGCDCRSEGHQPNSTRRFIQEQNGSSDIDDLPPLPTHYARMVWSTGGHSAAAGHGNLFNESYTAFMERGAKDVFAAVGIEFEGRNYAMGGTSSGPEVSLCSEAVFGTDPDVISWDYGMTEGGDTWKTLLYANRAGLNPNRPAVFGISLDGRYFGGRQSQLQHVEGQGLTTLILMPNEMDAARNAIPDMNGMTTEQMNSIPEYVRHFKCQDQIEKGDPYCAAEKYTSFLCNTRKYKASWHPGWRVNALLGNLMALYLSEMLIEAIEQLQELLPYIHATDLLSKLKAEEDTDYDKFFQSKPSDVLSPLDLDGLLTESNSSLLYRSPAICHTALLPAQTRYLGILTMSDLVGTHSYELGTPRGQADAIPEGSNMSSMLLVYDEGQRQDCPVDLQIDYKDYFFTTQNYGWTSLTVPNDKEMRAYGRDAWIPKGVVMICFITCDWGKCPTGDMRQASFDEGMLKMEVNDLPVTHLTALSGCVILGGENGYLWPASESDQYVLRTMINGTGYTRITSVIIL